jgi:hypothetical protein
MAKSFDDELLRWLREVPLARALEAMQVHVAIDRTYVPVKDARSERWIVTTRGSTSELLVTGVKWYDVRLQCGGGGAVDLVMHLEGLDFVEAVKRLSQALGVSG